MERFTILLTVVPMLSSIIFVRIGEPQLHILRECVVSYQVALGTPKGSVFTDKFSSVIQRLKEAGLIDKWIADKMDEIERQNSRGGSSNNSSSSSGAGSKAWTLSQLQAPFMICGMFMGLAMASFGTELAIGNLRDKSRTRRQEKMMT